MSRSRLLGSTLALALMAGASSPVLAQAAAEVAAPAVTRTAERPAPALVVTLVVDQLSANLLNQYRAHFTGGFKTLLEQGLVTANGFQTHGVTVTCAGHSTVLTGAHPSRTGIIANDWVDTTTGEKTYCLASERNSLAHGANTDNGPVGPERLLVETLGDWLKGVSPDSRVYAVSGKDRGAINLAGHKGDGAYWLTDGFGMTTYVEPSQSAEDRLAPIAGFNQSMAARFKDGIPEWDYSQAQCRALEGEWQIGDEVFRSRLPTGKPGLPYSPLLDELTLEAALHLLDNQQLGRRGVTDMLGVSLSATDLIGHGYGTQGPEMCEQLFRMDAALGVFLDRLSQVPGGVVLALTADHGGSDFPERTAERGYPFAGRLDRSIAPRINQVLRDRFNLAADPLVSSGGGFVVVDGQRRSMPEPLRSQVVAAAVELLNAEPQIAMAVARDELLTDPVPASIHPQELSLRERMRLSAFAGRSPDILRANQPGLTNMAPIGVAISSHGSPWDYDRGVPIIFWWPGAPGEERFMPLRTIDIAPTLANLIGVKPTGQIDGRCVDLPDFVNGKCTAE
ncbi:alkaline phosphatase family protein [Brevundimonas vesicularis]|uniref:alkaline phosphatase family protein n=1 Tax=Brevundimonas vesicularis TaxID=41276 RepID=UPI0038D373A2